VDIDGKLSGIIVELQFCKGNDTFRLMHPDADGTTHELHNPWDRVIKRSRLDYIFLRPGKAKWKIFRNKTFRGM